MKYALFTCLLLTCCVLPAKTAMLDAENRMLEAYGDLQYAKAKSIASQYKGPQFRLIQAMCDVFDRRTQNLRRGVPELEKLANSSELPERYRPTAKLAYARAMHTLAWRKNVYPKAQTVDPVPLYEEVMRIAPESIESISAVIYRSQYFLENGNADKAISSAEDFISAYKGYEKCLLVPIHLMLKDMYIRNGARYKKAIVHAEMARKLVPATRKTVYLLHFQIARMYDVYLKDYAKAEQEYISYLEKYPNTSEATLAARFLKELKAGQR